MENWGDGVEKAGDKALRPEADYGANIRGEGGGAELSDLLPKSSERGDNDRPLGATWVADRKRIQRKEVTGLSSRRRTLEGGLEPAGFCFAPNDPKIRDN